MVNVNKSSQTQYISSEIQLSPNTQTEKISEGNNIFSEDSFQKTPKKLQANDSILFIGLNPGHKVELAVLREASIKNRFQIENISDTENWKIDNFNLRTESGISDFIDSLGLKDEAQKRALKNLILDIDANNEIFGQKASARDEIASIIKVWSRAEKGEEIPSRFVISGHGNSISIWGENDKGYIELTDIKALATIMPKASAQIEDIIISACRCAYKDNIDTLISNFTNLKTIWGYAGTAPLGECGGTKHFQEWELKTRGHDSNINRNDELKVLKGTSEFQNIAVWSKEFGYQRKPANMSEGFVELVMKTEKYRVGDFNTNNIKNELDALYDQIQDYKSNADPEYKETCIYLIERTNILRHFPETISKFDQVLGNEIKEAFEIANLDCPELKPTDKNKFISQFMKKGQALLSANNAKKFENLPQDKKQLVQKVANLMEKISILDNQFIEQNWLTSDLTDDIKNKILKTYNDES